MYKGEAYLLENERAKCKIVILEEGVFHLAITEKDFFVNPCFEPVEMRKINRSLDCEMKCKIGENLYLKVDEEFRTVQIFRECTTREIILEIFDIDLYLKEINGEVCQGNSFSITKSENERFFGLGKEQGYKVSGCEMGGIPYLYSSRGYGLINNTLTWNFVDFTSEKSYTWNTDWTEDFSIYLFFGSPKKIYTDLKIVIGQTPMPLKSTLGYIQYKQQYESQEEILNIAGKYIEKNDSIDMMTINIYGRKNGFESDGDFDEISDLSEMNVWLTENGIDVMMSIFPLVSEKSL